VTVVSFDREFRMLEASLEDLRFAFFGIETRHHADTTRQIEAMLDDEETRQSLAEVEPPRGSPLRT
jgi:hypothetical protein